MSKKRRSKAISRRAALKSGALGVAGLCFSGPLSRLMAAASAPGASARAKSVIQIWMWGGPAHLDTFDPKPDAGYDYCGPFNKAIATNADGVQIGAQLPLLAKQADKYSIVRSMTHGINAHETASYLVQTGREPGRLVFPSAGAVVSRFRGRDSGYTGTAPPYIVLTEPQGRFSEAGLLGQRYKPFATGGDPGKAVFAVEGIVAPGISDEQQLQRRAFLKSLDSFGNSMAANPELEAYEKSGEKAYGMMFGKMRQLFDLSTEPEKLREAYGRNKFGQSCLMARRLVEAGVPYITINYKGWDTHKQHFEIMQRKLPEMDQGMATLFQDLADRGLLDSTIVWWTGEFGRGPKVQWAAPWNGGRSHYGRCFSSVVGGGGFKGGQVVGASDARGETVADRPVYPPDMIGSIYELMGVPVHGKLPNPRGLDVTVLPDSAESKNEYAPLREIM